MSYGFYWIIQRLKTPKTVDDVVLDFDRDVIQRNPLLKDAYLRHRKKNQLGRSESLAFRRIIASRYGIADRYDLPNGEPSQKGWNKKLLAACQTNDQDEAVLFLANKILDFLEME